MTVPWRRSLSYRNQASDRQSKSINWFLYDRDLRHQRVNGVSINQIVQFSISLECIKKLLYISISDTANSFLEATVKYFKLVKLIWYFCMKFLTKFRMKDTSDTMCRFIINPLSANPRKWSSVWPFCGFGTLRFKIIIACETQPC